MKKSIRAMDGSKIIVDDKKSLIECFCCGNCCIGYNALVSHQEVALMAGHLGISPDDFISRYVDITQVGYLLRQIKSGCIFLVPEDNSPRLICSVYPARPEPCRSWTASFNQPECQAGLEKFLKNGSQILVAGEVYSDREQLENFYEKLRQA